MARDDSSTGIFVTRNGVREEIRIDRIDTRILDIYASWSPARRMEALANMVRGARKMLARQIRAAHPGWSEDEIGREVARRFRGRAG